MRMRNSIVRRDSAQFAAACQALLQAGAKIRFRANGRSMRPNILDNDAVIVASCGLEDLHTGDVALTRSSDGFRVHRVSATDPRSCSVITRSDAGQEDDPATGSVLGKVVALERRGSLHSLDYPGQKYLHACRSVAYRFAQAAAFCAAKFASASAFLAAAVLVSLLFTAAPAAAQTDLAVTADTAAPSPVAPLGQITYTVTVINNGPRTATRPVVTMNTPTGTTYVTAALTNNTGGGTWNLTDPGIGNPGAISFTRSANMGNGSTATFTFTVQLTAAATSPIGQSVNISSTTTDPNNANNTATTSVAIQTPNVSVTNADAPDPVDVASNITYTQAITNSSTTTPAVNLTFDENIPANTTYQSIAIPTGWTCPTLPTVGGTGAIACTAAALAANTMSTFTVMVQVNSTVASGSTITDTVNIGESGTDPGTTSATATTTVTVPDLSVTDAATPNPVATGSNITYTQVVTNNTTNVAAVGATLTTSTPAHTLFQSVTPAANWTCPTQPTVGGTGSIVCTATGTFAGSSTATFTVIVSVSPEAPVGSNIINSTTVSETGTDPNTTNNTATATVTVQGADLSMTQVASVTAIAPGNNITYTETVTNNGPNAATGATLYQQTPVNTTFVSMTPPTGWTCPTAPAVGGTGQVICTASATMAANTTTGNFSFIVMVGAGTAAGTVISNQADVTSQTTDGNSANNGTFTSVLVEISADADISLAMTALPTPVFISSSLSYTIQVSNLGLAAGAGVTVTDTLPTMGPPASLVNALSNVSASSTQGTCTVTTSTVPATVSCPLGAVAYPLAVPITITISGTTPATPVTLSNQVSVSSTSTDPVASNNSVTVLTVVQPLVCAKPGNDGAQGSLSGIVNAYFPPASAGTVAAGATSIALGPAAAGGAQTDINAGDLVLIIQMQGAQINSTNTTSYGDGIPGDPFGSTSLGPTGMFEFVTATNTTAVTASAGGTFTFTGTGANNGLLNSYTSAAATATQGIQTFQVIRVPQYSSATLSPTSAVTALGWNGATGGVLALDVASQLTLNGGSVVLDGLGFRGGAGITERGITGFLKTDTVDASPTALPNLSGGGDPPAGGGAGGGKGEGIAGTPHWVAPFISTITHASTASSTAQAAVEGYPNGSFARGAPGNAGGGATDADPTANDQNSGGGGAGNGGQGGLGGFGWNTAGLVGGYGGAPFPVTTSTLVMGGGGGGGTTNNGSYWDPATDTGNADCGLNCTGVYSSGGAGGGIVIIHAGSIVGAGTISSNGQTALEPENDGGGGGGAGGTIFLFANSGGLNSVTATALGGNGGDTWPESAPGTFPGNRHGAGGGGGGGVIFATAAPSAASSVSNGIPGWSTLANDPYGATPGLPGVLNSNLTITQTPGVQSGAYCAGADISVSNAGSPNPVLAGGTITYNQSIVNNGPLDALNATFSEVIPANTTFASLNFPTGTNGWTCTTPAVGSAGTISCNNSDVASGVSTPINVAVTVAAGTASGTVITDVVNGASGTNDPNLSNNSAIVQTTLAQAGTADLALTNSALSDSNSATVVVPTSLPTYNGDITYTQTVTNNGPSAASTVVLTEAIPSNTTFVSATPNPASGWTCAVASGTLTCSANAGVLLNAGASEIFTVMVNVASGVAAGTAITDTAQVSSTTTDPNPNNNSASTVLTVASAGQSDLSVTSTASPATDVTDGNNITYTQFVANNGPAATSGTATFTDAIPSGTSFVSFTAPGGWNCGTLPAVGATSGTITCTIASMAVTSSSNPAVAFPLVVKALLGDASGTAITNTANIDVPCSSTTDPNCGNNTASTTVTVASPTQAYIGITKTASPEPVDQNTTLTYTIQITNNGPAVAQNVVVNDPLPSQVTYASVSTTQGTCTYTAATTTVNCPIGSLSVGGLVIININVTANTFSSSTLATNTATVTSSTGDANPSNSATVTSTIAAPTAVQIASFRAVPRQGGGVLIEWRTREEVRNLGFNLFRQEGGARQKLNPSIIAGSALLIRGGAPQHSAKTYQWFDPAGTAQTTYELEDVDLNGTRMAHGPLAVDVSAAPSSGALKRALLLTQLSSAIARPVVSTPHLMPVPRPILPPTPVGTAPTSLDGDAAVRISVESEGWYHVSKAQLVAAGLDPNADARFLQLFAEGVEQPMQILGAQSGPLGPNDAIEFYGTGIDTPFSGTRVYWLIEGKGPAKRIRAIQPSVNGFASPESFLFTTILEQRTTYFGTLLNGDNNDNFFGDAVTSSPVDEQLTVAHADANSAIPVSVDITLQGATDQQPHSVSVSFNGAAIGTMNFANLANSTQNFPIDPSLLQEGANVVELTALDGDNDVSVVQSVALHYPHTYAADGDWLKATANAESKLHVTGFSNAQIAAFDITDPLNILQLQGQIAQEGSSYSITLAAPRSAVTQRTLLFFANDQISGPAELSFHQPAALASERIGAQMVIITHPDFAAALPPLVQFHQSQGLAVQVVSIEEIFDAFNYGERSPFAIRSFLQGAAANWSIKPQYLLLLGDASLDPRDYLGLGDFDFVPTRMIETQAFKTSSDDWFSDFNQSGFATIATGRIPADTLADAQLAVSKILTYATASGNAVNPQALLVADQNVGADFTDATKFAANNLPGALQPTEIFADGQNPAVVAQQIVAALNAGPLLVNYSGHGAEQQWSFEDLLDTNSAATLSNGNQPSVYILMDCLNGFFQDVYAQSLAEALLLAPNGGAAAVWASSGFTNQPPQAVMNQALLQSIKMNPSIALGTAILNAKSGVSDPDVRRTWILFGDPALPLQTGAAGNSANPSGPSGRFPIPVKRRPTEPPGSPIIQKSPY